MLHIGGPYQGNSDTFPHATRKSVQRFAFEYMSFELICKIIQQMTALCKLHKYGDIK